MSIRIYVHQKHQIKCRCVPGHTFAQAGCRDSDLRAHGRRRRNSPRRRTPAGSRTVETRSSRPFAVIESVAARWPRANARSNQFIVFDKTGVPNDPEQTIRGEFDTIPDLLAAMEEVRNVGRWQKMAIEAQYKKLMAIWGEDGRGR